MGAVHGRVVDDRAAAADLATYHPAAALRDGRAVAQVMRADLRVLRRIVDPA